MSISCQQCRERLGELLDAFPEPTPTLGRVSSPLPDATASPQSAPIEAASSEPSLPELALHIESCAQCKSDLAILSAARETLRALPMQTAPPDLRARVRTQLQSEMANSTFTATSTGAQPLPASENHTTSNRRNQSILEKWQAACRGFFRRPASVAWAGGLALAAFTIFLMQRNPNLTFSTRQPAPNDVALSDTPLSEIPASKSASPQNPAAGSRNARKITLGQGAPKPNTPKVASGTESVADSSANQASANRALDATASSTMPARERATRRAFETKRFEAAGPSSASAPKVSDSQPETTLGLPSIRLPRSEAPSVASRPKSVSSPVAGSLNGAALGEASIRLVWLPATTQPDTVRRSIGRAASGTALAIRDERQDEARESSGFISPRSMAKPSGESLKSAMDAAKPQTESAAPPASAPAPYAGLSEAPPPFQAGAVPAAPRNRDREEHGRGGGFGGSAGSKANSNTTRGMGAAAGRESESVPAQQADANTAQPGFEVPLPSAPMGPRAAKSKAPAPSLFRQQVMAKTPASERQVHRARLSVVPPHDIAQAQIEITLPAGVRLSGSKPDLMQNAPSQVLWRGEAKRGQAIKTEFALETTTPSAAPMTSLDVKLVEVTPSTQVFRQSSKETDLAIKAGQPGTEQRVITRRSIAVPKTAPARK